MAKKALDDLSFSQTEFVALANHENASAAAHTVNFTKNGTHFTLTFSDSPTSVGSVMGLDKPFQHPDDHVFFFTSGQSNSLFLDVTVAGAGAAVDVAL